MHEDRSFCIASLTLVGLLMVSAFGMITTGRIATSTAENNPTSAVDCNREKAGKMSRQKTATARKCLRK